MQKTIKVKDLLERVNKVLALPTVPQQGKLALSVMLESILHETGNYAGYMSLTDWNKLSDVEKILKEFDRVYLVHRNLVRK